MTEVAVDLYESLGPWRRADEETGDLLVLCEGAIAGLQPLLDVIMDDENGPGWSSVLDADRSPVAWLAWTGQFGGKRLLPHAPEAASRARLRGSAGFDRGRVSSLVGAAKATLTGTKTVYLIERHGGAYKFTISTLVSETPDPAATERAIREQKPGGLTMVYTTLTGGTYTALLSTHATYASLRAFGSYAEVLSNPTGP